LTRLKNCIKRIWYQEIQFKIEDNELFVREIFHPMFYSESKKKLKPEAFLPPSEKCEVSLLRRNYCSDDFCKNHSASLIINGSVYFGLATFNAANIKNINLTPTFENIAKIIASPLDENKNQRTTPPVFKNDQGLPMHADLLFSNPLRKGEVQTLYRRYANEIIKVANYFEDPLPAKNN
jgi:hypothetical protein